MSKKYHWIGWLLLLMIGISSGMQTRPSSAAAAASADKQIVAYFAQWGIYGRNYHVKNIVTSGSAEKITILNYAFGHVVDNACVMVTQAGVMDAWADYERPVPAEQSVDGIGDTWEQPLKGNFNQLKKLKAQYPHIKVMISLGGWTWSEAMSDAALTAESRQQTAASCIDLYIRGNLPAGDGIAAGVFDGIDIDWEYPGVPGNTNNYRPDDTENFTLLLEEFRRQLDEIDPNLLLTVATGAGIDKYTKLELDKIAEHLDYVNVMSYDFHGAWENTTNFHAPLYGSPDDPSTYLATEYNIDSVLQGYLAGGIPPDKLIMGVPFYGRGWSGVTNANNGLYQAATSGAPSMHEAGFEDYKILKSWPGTLYRDPITKAMWKFNGDTFWSYDDAISMAEKMAYINENGLAGAMVWSLDGDDSTGSLMTALHSALQQSEPPAQSAGDVNCDGALNSVDALFILQHTTGLRGLSNDCPPLEGKLYTTACDVTGDGRCDAVDALFVLQCSAGASNLLCE